MAPNLIISKLKKIEVGDSITVRGVVPKEAKRFAINLGQDENFLVHINPRFDDNNVVVYNSLKNGVWGTEQRDDHFPFQHGEEISISFLFNGNEVVVNYPYGHRFVFRSEIHLNYIEYISVDNFEVKSIHIN